MQLRNFNIKTEKVEDPEILERERREAKSKEQVVSCYNTAIDYMLEGKYEQALTWLHGAQSHLLGNKGEYVSRINSKIQECQKHVDELDYIKAVNEFTRLNGSLEQRDLAKYEKLSETFSRLSDQPDALKYNYYCMTSQAKIFLNENNEKSIKKAQDIVNTLRASSKFNKYCIETGTLLKSCNDALRKIDYQDKYNSLINTIDIINYLDNMDEKIPQIKYALSLCQKLLSVEFSDIARQYNYDEKIRTIERDLSASLNANRATYSILVGFFSGIVIISLILSFAFRENDTALGIPLVLAFSLSIINLITIYKKYQYDEEYFSSPFFYGCAAISVITLLTCFFAFCSITSC